PVRPAGGRRGAAGKSRQPLGCMHPLGPAQPMLGLNGGSLQYVRWLDLARWLNLDSDGQGPTSLCYKATVAAMANHVRDLPHLSLSLVTRLRLLLFGHEDLAGIVFWAALTGFLGALAYAAFREGTHLLERVFTGQNTASLVNAAILLVWWHRMLIPVVGGLLAGLVLYAAGRVLTVPRAVDYMEAVLVGDGRIPFRSTVLTAL